jgi:hypothetical protein
MHQPAAAANSYAAFPVLAPHAIKVVVRSSRSDGSRMIVVEAPACGTIADVKRLLCLPPLSMCSDASALELVLKGENTARAVMFAFHFDMHLTL